MDNRGSNGPLTNTGIASGPAPASAPVSPLRSNKNPANNAFRSFGSLFRPVKSCANLEAMNTTTPTQERDVSQPVNESSGTFMSRALFKSVRSCINLEGMDSKPVASPPQQAAIPEQDNDNSSGILFSSLKVFKVKTSMVSERDINLMAPLSS